jgi:hypothetical protein
MWPVHDALPDLRSDSLLFWVTAPAGSAQLQVPVSTDRDLVWTLTILLEEALLLGSAEALTFLAPCSTGQ